MRTLDIYTRRSHKSDRNQRSTDGQEIDCRERVEIASAEELATAVAERLGAGAITLSRYDAVTRPLDERLSRLRAELAALSADELLPAEARTILVRDQRWLGWLEVLTESTPAEHRAALARALNGRRFVVGPGQPARFTPERVTVV
jgi:hypothetical protein